MTERPAGRAAIAGWVMFDWACQPFFTLVTTFVFAPYVAAVLAPSPEAGQAAMGYATAFAGLVVALGAPVLGAVADTSGRCKAFTLAAGLVMALAAAGLWFAAPGAAGAFALALVLFVIATIAAEFAAVFNNAMMPDLVPRDRIGRLSGAGWAAGYAGGLASLVLVLGFMVASPETGVTILGVEPWFGLDPAAREGDRAAGPFTLVWFCLFILPLLLFTPERRASAPLGAAATAGLGQLRATLRDVRQHGQAVWFLLANLFVQNGLGALFAFGGIYAAGTFGWGPIELGIFGILVTLTGTFGALVGGRLDDRFGARAVIAGGVWLLVLVLLGILSLSRDHVGFVVEVVPPMPGDGLFASWSERAYLGLAIIIGLAFGPVQASARSMICRLAPAGQVGQFFGLLQFSGKATAFAGPLAVALATDIGGTQRAGLAVLFVFFAAALWCLAKLREPANPA